MKPFGSVLFLSTLILGALAAPPPGTASAAGTLTVNTLADENDGFDGTCSLREAIARVNAVHGSGDCDFITTHVYDAIQFSVTGTITLSSALPNINQRMTITGPGPSKLIIDAGPSTEGFHINAGVSATISGLTVTG